MKFSKVKALVLAVKKEMEDPYFQGFAAQLAFYFLLSTVPVLIVLSQLLGVFNFSMSFLTEKIMEYIPGATLELVDISALTELIGEPPTGGMNLALMVLAFWGGSRAQFSMARITNYTYTGGESTGAYWPERLRAMKTMAFSMFSLVFVLMLLVYGELILSAVLAAISGSLPLSSLGQKIFLFLRWPVGLGVYFLMVSYNYYVLPLKKLPYKKVIPGSIFASVGMLVATLGYSHAQKTLLNYSALYGSLASIVALLMWFFILAWILGLGIVCNKVFMDRVPS